MTSLVPLTFIDLFAGIGGMRLGFEYHSAQCVFSSEWDAFAQQTYQANFGEIPQGDITQIRPEDIPNHDILLAGFPCQAFSICGDQKGFFDTRGTLFFNIEEILKVKQPAAFLLENVKNLKSHDQGRTFKTILDHLKNLGYFIHHRVLNSLDFGVPQKRERTFIVGFKENLRFSFPKPLGIRPQLQDILEPESQVDPQYFLSEEIKQKRLAKVKPNYPIPSIWHENKSGNISALEYSCALRAGASYNYLVVNGVRRPTARELLRLQGFPDSFKVVVPYSQLRKQVGNSVTIPVIQSIASEMVKSLKSQPKVATFMGLDKMHTSLTCQGCYPIFDHNGRSHHH
ncbi:DNA cytosine methyltransferase [Spirulina subsalsa]|uniref:DNA cytosine methyltransferase n=1 Tax=Spirulina subsalsa TaxID=54311 RepID=UPI002237362B|nr:DNA cytosine methyltransferase [Spirulina subsalsa]